MEPAAGHPVCFFLEENTLHLKTIDGFSMDDIATKFPASDLAGDAVDISHAEPGAEIGNLELIAIAAIIATVFYMILGCMKLGKIICFCFDVK